MIKLFRDGIGIRDWNRYGCNYGTAIRWIKCNPGLFGLWIKDGGLHVGCWWQIRFELVAVHTAKFDT